jgi:hypothetical protein
MLILIDAVFDVPSFRCSICRRWLFFDVGFLDVQSAYVQSSDVMSADVQFANIQSEDAQSVNCFGGHVACHSKIIFIFFVPGAAEM